MTDQINTGGAAFPIIGTENTNYVHEGMTLRDYFAAKALPVLLSELYAQSVRRNVRYEDAYAAASKAAYELADAMLAARGGAL
ncbi:hypothetical protein [Pseudochrobactrum saccharolyticum]|uniref:Uncharacterized protein n=1 Tax=Pseudochrobactrum saccharolyticum TaxID=354352 RepID=A0A7W8EQF1_9HYPH|nr:hypothetical protein [Pseudochrobactrum saccharolyticum]KAB0538082.1 hypothetical protein F7P81_10155 [Pseudochrobactrum saccharolyticum]MBB5091307.1 hypothetical protein [Pseudochrobactrum saccharolyticum]MDP8250778.1 hypothetical protein [Pseudochrobactrum saccharolyticum]MDP8250805.1 hypothetical protein [Pseudochrobactrum saccharolyticum]